MNHFHKSSLKMRKDRDSKKGKRARKRETSNIQMA